MPEIHHTTRALSEDIVARLAAWRSRIRSSETSKAISRDAGAIIAKYKSGRSQKSIADEYGIHFAAISDFLTKIGIEKLSWADSHRKYSLNQNAFDEVTEESAYWVGFLMADGCVSDGEDGRYTLSLGLAERDAVHVEKFRRFLGSGQVVRREKRPDRTRSIKGSLVQGGRYARILIRSRRLVHALARYGVVPRKTFTARVIGLENDRHFWRGAIDGDGWVFGRSEQAGIALVGSLDLVEQFRSFVLGITPGFKGKPCIDASGIYGLRIVGRQGQEVIRYLYQDVSVSLDRKQALADAAMQTEFVDHTLPVQDGMIKAIRLQRGLNQREAAKLACVHFTYWNMVERNHKGIYSRVTRPTIEKICKALGCDPESIVAG